MIYKNIYGFNVQFKSDKLFEDALSKSLELYKDSPQANVDFYIEVCQNIPLANKVLSNNPKVHQTTEQGMLQRIGDHEIEWSYCNGITKVKLKYGKPPFLKGIYRQIRGMEYPNLVDAFQQVLHELVLVPLLYFQKAQAPIHASAVEYNGKAFLFAGTGGVGKSSAMLAMREIEGVKFLADDISVINEEGLAYPNFAWPKIYGYNCEGTDLENTVLQGKSLFNRLHFKLKNRINSSSVRRKVTPDKLYPEVSMGNKGIDTVYYLFREDVPSIMIYDMEVKDAVIMTKNIMKTEYSYFNTHLEWEEYNRVGLGSEAKLTTKRVFEQWSLVYESAFSNVNLKKVSIPLKITHTEYLQEVKKWLV